MWGLVKVGKPFAALPGVQSERRSLGFGGLPSNVDP